MKAISRLRIAIAWLAAIVIFCCRGLVTAQVQAVAVQGAADTVVADQSDDGQVAADALDGEKVVERLVDRCRDWLLPPGPNLKSLSYKFHLGKDERHLELVAGISGSPRAIWQGATLWTGFHSLAFAQDRFEVAAKRCPADAKHAEPFIELVVRPKKKSQPMQIAVGNGIDGTWRGYFSHQSTEMKLELDEKTHLPLREIHEHSQYKYSQWREVAVGKWAPMLVVVEHGAVTYRLHFEWLADAVWMLSKAEIVREDGTAATVASVSDVQVNDEKLVARQQAQSRERREARNALRQVLDKNSAWLAPKLPFETLSYSFKFEREDVLEKCAVRRDGFAVFEVAADGMGKLADRLGKRLIVTPEGETATAKRDAARASMHLDEVDDRRPNRAEQLRRCANIGCQFDLPLFELARVLDGTRVQIADSEWNGRPCMVVTLSELPRQTYLGCGVMLGFTSWSYIHHWYPSQEIIYIDKERMTPLHETFVVAGETRNVEIDFLDYQSLEQPGGKALVPMRIELVAKDYFTCHYQFQIVGGRHWMLERAESWFKPEEKCRGKIEDVRFDQPLPLADSAARQLQAYRRIFEPADALPSAEDQAEAKATVAVPEVDAKATQTVDTLPFALGQPIHIGSATVVFDLDKNEQLFARCGKPASEKSGTGGDRAAVLLIDGSNRLVSAGQADFAAEGDGVVATINFRDSVAFRDVVRFAVQGLGDIATLDGAEPRRLRVRGALPATEATLAPSIGDESGKTQLVDVSFRKNDKGESVAAVHFASRETMREFALDVSIAAFEKSGKLVFTGSKMDLVHVESQIVDRTSEIPWPNEIDPAQVTHVAVGLSRGQTVSAPIGSFWGSFMRGPSFPIEKLLAAETDACWRAALKQLDRQLNETLDHGLLGSDHRWRDQVSSHETAADKLHQHVDRLLEIVERAREKDVLAGIVRLLGFSGDDRAAEPAARLLSHADESVQDAAAIALGMLRRDAALKQLDAILSRPGPARDHPNRYLYYRTQRVALIALANIRSDASIPVVRQSMNAFIDGIKTSDHPNGSWEGTYYLFEQLTTLLGRLPHESYPQILTDAMARLEARKDLKHPVSSGGLLAALLQYGEAARPYLEARLRAGDVVAIYAVSESRDKHYVGVFRELLDRDLAASAWASIANYLWNAGTPEAVEVLREMFDRSVPRGEENLTVRLRVAEALAFLGDNRGFPVAFAELLKPADSETPSDVSRAMREQKQRESAPLSVFKRGGNVEVANFVVEQAKNGSPAIQKALLKVIDEQRTLHPKLVELLDRWSEDPSTEIASKAKRILGKQR